MSVGGAIFRESYRCTMGLCLGHSKLTTAIVVVACRRTDPARPLFCVWEWESPVLDFDEVARQLKIARAEYRPVLTVGYQGGRDDEEVFKVVSVRLGQHVEPAPGDQVMPTQFLIDDFRCGRMKLKPGGIVERDVKAAIWRDGTPDQTGPIAALRCADWAAQKYRQRDRKARTADEKNGAALKERARKMQFPY